MKALIATGISLALSAAVIGNAYYQKKQFYPSVVYLTNSNPSMAVMYIQAFIIVFLLGKVMRKIFFGRLRAAEFEHLMERSWYAITETCLAFTVFRDDFNPKFIALFTVLLFLKAFHWLAEDRVDFMERSPVISWLFHVRILALLVLLANLDLYFIMHAYQVTILKGPSVQLVFGFEYAILIIMIVNIFIKYVLHVIDTHWEAPWESKAAVVLYTELGINFLKVLLYLCFVAVMVRIYTLPLFAFRPMYYTMRSFKKAFNDVVMSRRAIRNMNNLYPDATAEELAAADNVCIICREEMQAGAKKLPCNHIFHAACLRSWFQRQQTCPTCRLNVLRPPPPPAPAQPAPAPFVPLLPHIIRPAPAAHFRPGVAPEQPTTSVPPPPVMPTMIGALPTSWGFPPLPTRPVDLATLTREQLKRMEGDERRNIMARLETLREVKTMVEASILLLQQYSTVAPSTMPSDVASQTDLVKLEPIEVKPEPAAASASEVRPSTSTANIPEAKSSVKTKIEPSTSGTATENPDTNREAVDSDAELLRKRRLQKFSQQN